MRYRCIAAAVAAVLLPARSFAQDSALVAHPIGRFTAHTGDGRRVAFTPDGALLATSGTDGFVRLWRTSDGRLASTLTHPGGVATIAVSPDGRWLASGGYDNTIRLWNLRADTLPRLLTGHGGTVWSLAFSRDGATLASGGEDNTIRLWRVSDGTHVRTLTGHTRNIWAIAFTPDGRLASGSFDETVRVWDPATGRQLHTLIGPEEAVVGLDIDPAGVWIAGGGDDRAIRLWRVRATSVDTAAALTLREDTDHVYAVAFSPDGRWLATGGREMGGALTLAKQLGADRLLRSRGRSVRLWRVADGALLSTLDTGGDVRSVAFSPDGRLLAASGEGGVVTVWRLGKR